MYHQTPNISGLIGRWTHCSLCETRPMNYCEFTECTTYKIGRFKRPISCFKAINDLAYLFWLNGPRIASQGLTGIKFCGLSRTIRPSCFFYVFAYSRPHGLTLAAYYGIMAMTVQVWPWQMWRLCEDFHFLLTLLLNRANYPKTYYYSRVCFT